jgi:hypothetical protein
MFAVFMYDGYYPSGGMSDYQGSFETNDEAKQACHGKSFEYAEIVDIQPDGLVLLERAEFVFDSYIYRDPLNRPPDYVDGGWYRWKVVV